MKAIILGIFTDGDLRRALQNQGPSALEKPIGELMTVNALTIEKGKLAWEALKIMQKDPKKFVMVLPVLDQGKAVGFLRMHDIVQRDFLMIGAGGAVLVLLF